VKVDAHQWALNDVRSWGRFRMHVHELHYVCLWAFLSLYILGMGMSFFEKPMLIYIFFLFFKLSYLVGTRRISTKYKNLVFFWFTAITWRVPAWFSPGITVNV
jgi:hypothetical protein